MSYIFPFPQSTPSDPIQAALSSSSVASDLLVPLGTVSAGYASENLANTPALYGATGLLHGCTLVVNTVTLTCNGATNTASSSALVGALNAALTGAQGVTAAINAWGYLDFTKTGAASTIVIGAGTANAVLGLVAGTYGTSSWRYLANKIAGPNYYFENSFVASVSRPYANIGVFARGIITATGGTLYYDGPWATNQAIVLPPGGWGVDILAVYPQTSFTDGVLYS